MILSTVVAAFSIAGLTMLHSGTITVADIQAQQSQGKPAIAVAKPADKTNKASKITVKRGDSLTKLANRHHSTWRRIYDANKHVKDPNMINPGDKLRIPEKSEKLKHRPLPASHTVFRHKATKNAFTAPAQYASYPAVNSGSVWDRLAQCESGGNWGINTGNGYYGGLQFTLSTWRSLGGSGYPNQASRSEQIARAKILQARSGWGQWPACSAKLGLL
jgi:LysM repeat protein